jgi:hypothetical protein
MDNNRYSESLRASSSRDRNPVGVRDFPHPSRPGLVSTYPPVQRIPALFSGGVKRPGRGDYHPPPSSTEVKERVELYRYSLSGLSWPVLGSNLPRVRRPERDGRRSVHLALMLTILRLVPLVPPTHSTARCLVQNRRNFTFSVLGTTDIRHYTALSFGTLQVTLHTCYQSLFIHQLMHK